MNADNSKQRFSIIATIITVLVLTLSVITIYQTGIIKGINPQADAKRADLMKDYYLSNNVEGTFYDRNNVQLTSSNDTAGKASTILYTHELSSIIGTRNGSDLSGLRARLKDQLYDMGSGTDGVGADVQLTLDINLQSFAYSLLEDKGFAGNITVIDADTGEILCMAARGHQKVSFDANKLKENYSTYISYPGSMLNSAVSSSHTAGSVIKILIALGIIRYDIEQDYVLEDPYITPAGKPIYNFSADSANRTVPDGKTTVNLQRSLNQSINTYFATRGLLMGTEKVSELFESFHIGKSIELDFTTLNSGYSFKGEDPVFELASTCYGQGKTQISPLHLTAIMSAIISEGRDMVKPYLIKEITNEGKSVHKGKTEYLTKNALGPIEASKLKKLLHNTATDGGKEGGGGYGFDDESKIIAKTGTSETDNKKYNHCYILIGYSYNGRNYAICIDRFNAPRDYYGRNLVDLARSVIAHINEVAI